MRDDGIEPPSKTGPGADGCSVPLRLSPAHGNRPPRSVYFPGGTTLPGERGADCWCPVSGRLWSLLRPLPTACTPSFLMQPLQDLNVRETIPLISPRYLKHEENVTDAAIQTVVESRETVKNILAGRDHRLMVIVGPCSIHDQVAGLEYARKLRTLAERVKSHMLVVMRVYFEKPRTTVGWKGLINDPHLNDTFDIGTGLRIARRILLEVANMGLPAATELLEPITPQYIADLISVAAIGARTTESPTHRQMASGLSMPVGYKNGTDGSLQVAIDAMLAAQHPHSFLGMDGDGKTCIINTKGNPWGFLILRGGRSGPNYDPALLTEATEKLNAAKLTPRLMVDCSHANSNKDYTRASGSSGTTASSNGWLAMTI